MTDHHRRGAGAVVAAVIALILFVPSTPVHGVDASVRTVEPPPSSTEPTVPETTQPETTQPENAEPAPDDESDLTAVTIVGFIGFAILVGLAAWWMVSRRDEDDAPHPPPPGVDEPLPGQDLL